MMARPWFWDTETFLIQPGQGAPRPVSIQWTWDPRTPSEEVRHLNPGIDRSGWEEFQTRLHDPETLLVGHNVAYDLAVMCSEHPEFIKPVFAAYAADRVRDTMDRQKLLDIAQGIGEGGWISVLGERQKAFYDLGTTAARHAPILLDKSDPWRTRYGELWNVPVERWPEEAIRYARMDPRGTGWAYLGQELLAGLLLDQSRQARAAWWIHLMGTWGVRTDFETVKEAEADVLAEIVRDRQTLIDAGLVRVKDGSRNETAAKARMLAAFRALGEPARVTDKGLEVIGAKHAEEVAPEQLIGFLESNPAYVALDEDSCAASRDPIMEAFGRYGSAKTLLKKVRRLYKGSGSVPLQASFVTLMETGRTSCRQGVKERGKDEKTPSLWGTQLQNPPREGKMRECFVPRPGFIFADSDYSGMELCTWAQVCIWALGRSELARALNEGKDPHSMVAAVILGRPYEWVLEARKGKHGPEAKKAVDDARQSGKIANFGWPGGMGPATLREQARAQYGVHMTLDECKNLKAVWLATWPEGADYFRWVNSLFRPGTKKTTIKHFLSDRVRGDIPYTVTCNSFFQGLAADAAKAAGFAISRECYAEEGSDLYGSRIVNFVHDQFLVEVPTWKASRAALRMDFLMRSEAQKWIPDVRITTEPALTSRWFKGAGPVWADETRKELLEWQPKKD